MATPRVCSIPDCGKRVHARGWCSAHLCRFRRNGDPLGGRTRDGVPVKFFHETVLKYEGNECLLWPYGKNHGGYAMLWVDGQMRLLPRLVCAAVYGPPAAPRLVAAHSCGNGHLGCITKSHLRWATQASNMRDMVAHGRTRRGPLHPHAKLNLSQVHEIRALQGKMLQREIAALYGITRTTVSGIFRGLIWSHS